MGTSAQSELSVPVALMLIEGRLCGSTPFGDCQAVVSCSWTAKRPDTQQIVGHVVLEFSLGGDGTGDLVISDPVNGIQFLDAERRGTLDAVSIRGVTKGYWPVTNLNSTLRKSARQAFARNMRLMAQCANRQSKYSAI